MKQKNISENVLETEDKTDNGEILYKTKDNAVVIKGTVLGGNAQVEGSVVDNINVIVTDNAYSSSVNNSAGSGDGSFEIVLPLKKGDNEVVFLASSKKQLFPLGSLQKGYYQFRRKSCKHDNNIELGTE
ncbi:MAG: hypothetical protein H6681_02715 [Desulfobacteraceae bacterium]|nr:hypothetical protein [Desulfobacteraceae bacterium]